MGKDQEPKEKNEKKNNFRLSLGNRKNRESKISGKNTPDNHQEPKVGNISVLQEYTTLGKKNNVIGEIFNPPEGVKSDGVTIEKKPPLGRKEIFYFGLGVDKKDTDIAYAAKVDEKEYAEVKKYYKDENGQIGDYDNGKELKENGEKIAAKMEQLGKEYGGNSYTDAFAKEMQETLSAQQKKLGVAVTKLEQGWDSVKEDYREGKESKVKAIGEKVNGSYSNMLKTSEEVLSKLHEVEQRFKNQPTIAYGASLDIQNEKPSNQDYVKAVTKVIADQKQFTGLDPKSPTFKEDFAKLDQNKIGKLEISFQPPNYSQQVEDGTQTIITPPNIAYKIPPKELQKIIATMDPELIREVSTINPDTKRSDLQDIRKKVNTSLENSEVNLNDVIIKRDNKVITTDLKKNKRQTAKELNRQSTNIASTKIDTITQKPENKPIEAGNLMFPDDVAKQEKAKMTKTNEQKQEPGQEPHQPKPQPQQDGLQQKAEEQQRREQERMKEQQAKEQKKKAEEKHPQTSQWIKPKEQQQSQAAQSSPPPAYPPPPIPAQVQQQQREAEQRRIAEQQKAAQPQQPKQPNMTPQAQAQQQAAPQTPPVSQQSSAPERPQQQPVPKKASTINPMLIGVAVAGVALLIGGPVGVPLAAIALAAGAGVAGVRAYRNYENAKARSSQNTSPSRPSAPTPEPARGQTIAQDKVATLQKTTEQTTGNPPLSRRHSSPDLSSNKSPDGNIINKLRRSSSTNNAGVTSPQPTPPTKQPPKGKGQGTGLG